MGMTEPGQNTGPVLCVYVIKRQTPGRMYRAWLGQDRILARAYSTKKERQTTGLEIPGPEEGGTGPGWDTRI